MRSRRKKGGQVTALMYIYREQDDEEFKIEVEVSGYYTPEQQATEVDPPIEAGVEVEEVRMTTNDQAITLTESEMEKATEALWSEITGE